MDKKSFKALERWFKTAGPKQFIYAAKGVLNTFAFGTKQEIPKEIDRNMIVRNTGFIRTSVRVDKARGSTLNSIYSQTYVIRRNGFSGWVEQEFGKKTILTRTITKAARGGSWSKKVKSQARLKITNDFFDPDRYSGNSYEHKISKMLGAMRYGRALKKRPFKIKKSLTGNLRGMKKGIYGWTGNRTTRLQNFEKNTQPKRIPIVKRARMRYFASANIQNIWSQNIRRQLKITR